MARAYGSSAHLLMKRETTYGQAATGNYIRMPFNRCNLGSEQGLIDDPVLGQRPQAGTCRAAVRPPRPAARLRPRGADRRQPRCGGASCFSSRSLGSSCGLRPREHPGVSKPRAPAIGCRHLDDLPAAGQRRSRRHRHHRDPRAWERLTGEQADPPPRPSRRGRGPSMSQTVGRPFSRHRDAVLRRGACAGEPRSWPER